MQLDRPGLPPCCKIWTAICRVPFPGRVTCSLLPGVRVWASPHASVCCDDHVGSLRRGHLLCLMNQQLSQPCLEFATIYPGFLKKRKKKVSFYKRTDLGAPLSPWLK